jgi:hypothetical protein
MTARLLIGGEEGGVVGDKTCDDFKSPVNTVIGYTGKFSAFPPVEIDFKTKGCHTELALICVQTPTVCFSLLNSIVYTN